MVVLTEKKYLESVVGQTSIVFPTSDYALYGGGVTTDAAQAQNKGRQTVAVAMLLLTDRANNIGQVQFWDVDGTLLAPEWLTNYNEQSNKNPTAPSGETPRSLSFGPGGLYLPFGIGLRTLSSTAHVRLIYREVVSL